MERGGVLCVAAPDSEGKRNKQQILFAIKTIKKMKKLILLSALLGLAVFSYSQTYYYECTAFIDKDGVKNKPGSSNNGYKTFTNNKSIVYSSDEDGNSKGNKFYYRRTQNGTHVYESKSIPLYPEINFSTLSVDYSEKFDGNFMYFSSDYSQIIFRTQGVQYEYIRTEGPKALYDDVPIF